ncbi:MAG: VOC family protein [Candidatus Azobacteroides sp.]|nr:VOC family protein [Candidatus Azobacteroides sp.]
MEMKVQFDHYNCNVFDLTRSISFYDKALGLKESHRIEAENGSYIIVYLKDAGSSFLLELTWLRDWKEPYRLGDNEQHLCVRVYGDYSETRRYHKENGWVCYENQDMGLYFIEDPDGYWIEILPAKSFE